MHRIDQISNFHLQQQPLEDRKLWWEQGLYTKFTIRVSSFSFCLQQVIKLNRHVSVWRLPIQRTIQTAELSWVISDAERRLVDRGPGICALESIEPGAIPHCLWSPTRCLHFDECPLSWLVCRPFKMHPTSEARSGTAHWTRTAPNRASTNALLRIIS